MEVDLPCKIIGSDWGDTVSHPVASWFDEAQKHFIALLARKKKDANPPGDSVTDLVEYRIIVLEDNGEVHPGPVLQTYLPTSLVVEYNNSNESSSRRKVPLLAKLSLDQKLLAIQFSNTLIRIIPLEGDKQSKHWTIELEASGEPIYGPSDSVPHPRYKAHYDSMTCKDSTILGIVWSDHGGNSQDLVIVTTKAVLCYKVSLPRNQMAATHTFPHARLASSMWWEPKSRTILVGSYGPVNECSNANGNGNGNTITTDMAKPVIQMQPYILQFPQNKKSKRLPRFELPPPKRLYPFAAGFGENGHTSTTALLSSSDVQLINLYGKAYTVEFCFEVSKTRLVLHKVDTSAGGANNVKEYFVDGTRLTKTNVETRIIAVLDNILVIVFRECRLVLFIDVEDSGNSYIIHEWAAALDPIVNRSVSSLYDDLLWDRNEGGRLVRLSLNIWNLASKIQNSPAVVPFLLRRSHPQAHDIALEKFSTSIRQGSRRVRHDYIHAVIQVYAGNRQALVKDWEHDMSFMIECALLPPPPPYESSEATLSNMSNNSISSSNKSNSNSSSKENIESTSQILSGSQTIGEEQRSVLYQREIIQTILLPMAKDAVRSKSEENLVLAVDITIGLVAALDRYMCFTCPALECLMVALLWHLGYNQELIAFVRSRRSSRVASFQNDIPPPLLDSGTITLLSFIMRICEDIKPGLSSVSLSSSAETAGGVVVGDHQVIAWKETLISESTKLLISRVTDPWIIIRYFLSRRKLSIAMTHVLLLLDSNEGGIVVGERKSKDTMLLFADNDNIFEEFLRVALNQMQQQQEKQPMNHHHHHKHPSGLDDGYKRLLFCLHSLLLRLDANYLQSPVNRRRHHQHNYHCGEDEKKTKDSQTTNMNGNVSSGSLSVSEKKDPREQTIIINRDDDNDIDISSNLAVATTTTSNSSSSSGLDKDKQQQHEHEVQSLGLMLEEELQSILKNNDDGNEMGTILLQQILNIFGISVH